MSLARFADWLWLTFQTAVIFIHNMFILIINKMIDGVAKTANLAIAALPSYTAPTAGQLVDNIGFLSALNWVLPISFFMDCMTMLVFGYLAFHASAPVLRWTKLIR